MSVECVVKHATETIGEGPHWDDATQTLLYVDINSGDVHRYDPATNKDEKLHFDNTVSLVVPCRKGGYIISIGRTLARLDWDTKKVTMLVEVDQGTNNRFNDGKCDPKGRLWAGTMGHETAPAQPELHKGHLFSLDLDGKLKTHLDKINGMAIDTEGMIWVACFGAGKVVRFNPNTGEELRTINIPGMRTTSCCFGGKNLDELYVTCAKYHASEEELSKYPLSGSLFKVTGLGVKGFPAFVYEG
ncbi:hypothetical protein KUTeg_016077 [Tegillarca granosa]|uniref:SMP-30/Gluconolactonase/LRE-like region domain-containing protein n=1 Tax=Tegillarca granosa TaxID=220873 RepID=A0ABQ9EPJ8_TEGGR|nr:hypothetical protein KUTeg_016077 [Tegillarca granosa]